MQYDEKQRLLQQHLKQSVILETTAKELGKKLAARIEKDLPLKAESEEHIIGSPNENHRIIEMCLKQDDKEVYKFGITVMAPKPGESFGTIKAFTDVIGGKSDVPSDENIDRLMEIITDKLLEYVFKDAPSNEALLDRETF